MKSFRIRLVLCLSLAPFSCGFSPSSWRPVAIQRQNSHQHSSLLLLSSTPSDEDANDATLPPESQQQQQLFDPELRRIMGSLATLGVLETGFLTYSKLVEPSLDICGTAGGDCASVLNGPYSTLPLTNIPLAALGLLAYLTTAYLALEPVMLERDDSDQNRVALLVVTTAMGTFSIYLLTLIYGILHTSCLYCLASAILSISLASCAWLGGCFPSQNVRRGVQAGLASVAATTLAALLLFVSVPTTNESSLSSTLLASTTTTSTNVQQQTEQSPPPITTESSPRALALSQDLRQLNAKMYGAYWCSHCYDQKQSLGKRAFSNIEYFECSAEGTDSKRDLCKERDVPGYPTWEINGKLYPGERELDELEEIVQQELK